MKNFGDFLKGFAYLFLIGGICLVIEIVIKLASGDGIEAAIVIGGIVLFPTFAIIYGFGEIISKLCMIEGNTRMIANNTRNLAANSSNANSSNANISTANTSTTDSSTTNLSTTPVTPVNNIAEFFPSMSPKQEEIKISEKESNETTK